MKKREFLENNSGRIEDVLFERTRNNGLISGFTGNYIRVEYPWMPKLAGTIRKVRLKSISDAGRMYVELID